MSEQEKPTESKDFLNRAKDSLKSVIESAKELITGDVNDKALDQNVNAEMNQQAPNKLEEQPVDAKASPQTTPEAVQALPQNAIPAQQEAQQTESEEDVAKKKKLADEPEDEITLEEIQQQTEAAAAGGGEGGSGSDLPDVILFGQQGGVNSIPRDLGLLGLQFGQLNELLPNLFPVVRINRVPTAQNDLTNSRGDALIFFESSLPKGSAPGIHPLVLQGNILSNDDQGDQPATIINFEIPGFQTVKVGDVWTITTSSGIITLYVNDVPGHQKGDFTYELIDSDIHPNGGGINNLLQSFTYTIQDSDGDTSSAEIIVTIVDDVPVARDDGPQNIEEGQPPITGNLMSNDIPGADQPATVISFTHSGGIPGALGVPITTTLGGILILNPDGSFSYTPPPNINNATPVSDNIVYTISDVDGDTSTATYYINITDGPGPDPEDDGVNPEATVYSVYEAGLPAGSANDPDNPAAPDLTKVTTVTGNLLSNDFLGTDPSSIVSVTFNASTYNPDVNGIVTVTTPSGTLVVYTQSFSGRAAGDFTYTLNAATDQASGLGNNLALDDFIYRLQDTDGDFGDATLRIRIVDDVPQAVNDPDQSVSEGSQIISGNVLSNDIQSADNPNNVISFTYNGGANSAVAGQTVTTALGGLLTVNANGSWTYTSPPNVNNSTVVYDGFVYTLEDGDGDQSSAIQRIQINDGPGPDPEDDGVNPNGNLFTVYEAGLSGGSGNDPDNPAAPDATKVISVSGNILSNDFLGTDPSSVISVRFGVSTFTPNANGVIMVTTPSGTLLVYTQPFSGHVPGEFTYTLNAATDQASGLGNNLGLDDFIYRLQDTDGDFGDATLRIRIVDDVPQAVHDADRNVNEGHQVISGNVLNNDIQSADNPNNVISFTYNNGANSALAGQTVTTALGGLLTVNANGSWTYNSPANVNNNAAVYDGFIYTLEDGDGDRSTATQRIQINDGPGPDPEDDGVNPNGNLFTVYEAGLPGGSGNDPDNPAAPDSSKVISVSGNILSNDFLGTDPSSVISVRFGATTFTPNINGVITATTPSGTLVLYTQPFSGHVPGEFTYTLNAATDQASGLGNNLGLDDFIYRLQDTDGDFGDATLRIRIVDDVPQAVNDADRNVNEGHQVISGNVLNNDIQSADNPNNVISFTYNNGANSALAGQTVTTALGGLLTVNANGAWTYTSPANVNNSSAVYDGFVYTFEDGDGDRSTATQRIQICDGPGPDPEDDGVNPNGNLFTVYEAGLPSGSGNDPDNPAAPDVTKVISVSGNILSNDFLGTDPSSIVSVRFGASTFTPNANGVVTISTPSGTLLVYTQPFSGRAAGDFTYTLNAAIDQASGLGNNLGLDDFVYRLRDTDGDFGDATLRIRIVDDVPQAVNDADRNVNEGHQVISGNVLNNDIQSADNPNNVISFTYNNGANSALAGQTVTTALGGLLTVNANGSWTYNSPANVNNSAAVYDGFVYTLEDGDGDRSTATQRIQINDGPGPDPEDDGVNPNSNLFTVYEAGLPSGSAKDPDNPAAPDLTKVTTVTGNLLSNDFLGTDPSSIVSMRFGASTFTPNANGVITVTTPSGTLVVYTQPFSGRAAGDFTYTLNAATDQASGLGNNLALDDFIYRLQDTDGDFGDATLRIRIVDDVPQAVNDADRNVNEGHQVISGNVLNNDIQSADNPNNVISFTYNNGANSALAGQTVTTALGGLLTVNANGSWTYNSPANVNNNAAVYDGFVYTLEDGDGDRSTATQRIQINDGPGPDPEDDGVNPNGEQFKVYESSLSDGSSPNTPSRPTSVHGNVLGNDNLGTDGSSITSVTLGVTNYTPNLDGVIVATTAFGTLTLYTRAFMGHVAGEFTYQLNDNLAHTNGLGNNIAPQDFTYTLTDIDGDSGSAILRIQIVDDVPTAVNDLIQANEAPVVSPTPQQVLSGNVITNDTAGADKAIQVTTFTYNSGSNPNAVGTVGVPVTTALGGTFTLLANGTFTYKSPANGVTADSTDRIRYTISDNDGDTSTANLDIRILNTGPTAVNDMYSVNESDTPPKYNLIFVLDTSGSMGWIIGQDGVNGSNNRLNKVKEALNGAGNLFDSYAAASSDLKITIITFNSSATSSQEFSTIAAAKTYVNGLTAGGSTNYDAAIDLTQAAITADSANPSLNDYIDKVYFLSDGQPFPLPDNALSTQEIADWQNVLSQNAIDSIVLNIAPNPSSVNTYLEPIANPTDSPLVIQVASDLSNLNQLLLDTIEPTEITGNVLTNDVSGPNPPISVTGFTYDNGVNPNTAGLLGQTVTTALGGKFTLYADGSFTYLAPSSGVMNDVNDFINYTIRDLDGDLSTAQLKITVLDENPLANDDISYFVEPKDYNLVFGIDVSGSMDELVGGKSRLDITKAALIELLENFRDIAGGLNITLIPFASASGNNNNGAFAYHATSVQNAINYINNTLDIGMKNPNTNQDLSTGTQYNDALYHARVTFTADLANPALTGYENRFYFLSDGMPNSGHSATNTGNWPSGWSSWQAYIDANGIDAIPISIATTDISSSFVPVGNAGDSILNVNPDLSNLTDILLSTIDDIHYNALVNDIPGADNAFITQIAFEVPNAANFISTHGLGALGAVADANGTTIRVPVPSDGQTIEFTTLLEGKLSINKFGDYSYAAADNGTMDVSEEFIYKLTEPTNPNDFDFAKITVNIIHDPASLDNLLGDGNDNVLSAVGKEGIVIMQGNGGHDNFVIDASMSSPTETVVIKDFGQDHSSTLTFVHSTDTNHDTHLTLTDVVQSVHQDAQNANVTLTLYNGTSVILENIGTLPSNDLVGLNDHLQQIAANVNVQI
ncbi:MAG: Ig-like domain-containing protein [Gammaproteobacteria bacterium]